MPCPPPLDDHRHRHRSQQQTLTHTFRGGKLLAVRVKRTQHERTEIEPTTHRLFKVA